jgi:hypothetical protein
MFKKKIRVRDPDPDPDLHGSALIIVEMFFKKSGLGIQIRIQICMDPH